MGADENTTDKHDESDSAQFGDDPHHLNNTPFEEAACHNCGTYLVKARGYTGICRCLGCARTHHNMTWASGEPIGEWHPTVGYQLPTPPRPPHTPQPHTEWQWACLQCAEIGPAYNAQDALNREAIHTHNHHRKDNNV